MEDQLPKTFPALLKALYSKDRELRQQSLQQIMTFTPLYGSGEELVRALENLILREPDAQVQKVALDILALPIYREIHRLLHPVSKDVRLFMLNQVYVLEEDGLLDFPLTDLLRGRYAMKGMQPQPAEDLQPGPEPQPSQVPPLSAPPIQPAPIPASPPATEQAGLSKPSRSLGQLLLSDTSIKIALYLGAFFIVAAAIILAALIEIARLPILGVTTLISIGAAVYLSRRLPLASIVLFTIGTFLIPIDTGVLTSLLKLEEDPTLIFWGGAMLVCTAAWLGGTALYRSRFFSILAFGGLAASVLLINLGTINVAMLIVFQMGVIGLCGNLVSVWLVSRQEERLAWPIFLVSQFFQACVLLLSLMILVSPNQFEVMKEEPWQWLALAATWGVSVFFYESSSRAMLRTNKRFPFELFTVGCLLFTPLFALGVFSPRFQTVMTVMWLWGVLLIIVAESTNFARFSGLRRFQNWLYSGGGLLILSVFLAELREEGTNADILFLLLNSAVFFALTLYRPRWVTWSAALVSIISAYLFAVTLPIFEPLDIPRVYYLFPPTLILLSVEQVLHRRRAIADWTQPAFVLGLICGFLNADVLLISLVEKLSNPPIVVICTGYSIFLTAYTFFQHRKKWHWFFWSAALFSAYLAYILGFQLAPIARLEIPYVYILLPFTLTLLSLELIGNRIDARKDWTTPPLVLAILTGGLNAILLIASLSERMANIPAILVCSFYAVYLVFYSLLHQRTRGRWISWGLALLSAYVAYLLAFWLPAVIRLNIPDVFRFLPPTIILLMINLYGQRKGVKPDWTLPTLILGLISGCVQIYTLIEAVIRQTNSVQGMIVCLTYAAFLTVYSVIVNRPWVSYIAAASLTSALGFGLLWSHTDAVVLPFSSMALLFYLVGIGLRRNPRTQAWMGIFRNSGLILGASVGVSALAAEDPGAILGVSVIATFYAVEALRQRNVWLGFPINLLYFIAYLLALRLLEVREPQFFTIAAALLGIVMHYLLMRTENELAALVTGLLSQLVLLSTTYFQMVSAGELSSFFLIFFQALSLLIYGLVVRSRTFVLVPIAFLVLSVATVTLTVLSGLPTALIIGCTGMLLLGLGILALLLRERLLRTTDALIQHLNHW